ncbi:MAG TPA: succinyl-diaminopimelate desuccinylase [Acidimicrobiales bacterium]|nr:succinyl-diaminopimelate desuccinylase [Acidimicrobiales bacterium]
MSRLDEALTLVSISSVSRNETELAAHVEGRLRAVDHLDVERVGDNVIARSTGHHATRVLVAGHLDTVPGDARAATIVEGQLRGVGACDMKGSLAVMLAIATDPTPRSIEVTWIFYAREEITRSESGLSEIAELRPDLLQGDVALLAEPTGGQVEAGCQGTLKVSVQLAGFRAHAARPFTGRNAIHRLADVIALVAAYEPRVVDIEGVQYTEQLQAVGVEGGIAPNVVPDLATLTINHRVAPDRSKEQAASWLREYLGSSIEEDDKFSVLDWAPGALPSLGNERLSDLVRLTGHPAEGKVGWTDVATFQELGVPATNFGAGDPLLAHRSDEFVTLDELTEFEDVLKEWLA